uniref:Uncharacterized protein n=1 Tax=Glossina pallidipes TaxID=7398 RepID=A0A1A9ZVC0_GLOPL
MFTLVHVRLYCVFLTSVRSRSSDGQLALLLCLFECCMNIYHSRKTKEMSSQYRKHRKLQFMDDTNLKLLSNDYLANVDTAVLFVVIKCLSETTQSHLSQLLPIQPDGKDLNENLVSGPWNPTNYPELEGGKLSQPLQ